MDARGFQNPAFGWRNRRLLGPESRIRPSKVDLHLRHGKGAGTGTCRAAGQSPGSGDGVSVDGTGEGQGIAGGRSGLNGHAKLAVHIAIEISAQNERAVFGLA